MVRTATSVETARQTLDEFYSELAEKWKEAEQVLLSLRVPTAVTVPIKRVEPLLHERDFLPATNHELGYIKHYGRWSLCYGVTAEGDDDQPGSGYWISIGRCSAEQQVEAAKVFPRLLDEVTQVADGHANTVLEAVESLDEVLAGQAETVLSNGKAKREKQPEPEQVQKKTEPALAAAVSDNGDGAAVNSDQSAEEH